MIAMLAIAAAAYARPAEGYILTYLDQYGNAVGKEELYCNGVHRYFGQITGVYEVTESWVCPGGP